MGWGINWDRPLDDIKRTTGINEDLVKNVRGGVQQIGQANRGALGSFGYVNALGGSQLASDYFNQEDKKKQAEDEASAAQERVNQSVSAADRVRNQQGLFAAEMKKNAFRDAGLLTGKVAGNERRAMAENIRNAKLSANARGLLGSGLQKEKEAGSRATAAANTASKQKQIQDLMSQQVMDAEDLQAQLGLEMGGVQQNMADQYYRQAVENMNNRNQSYSEILGAGARVGGAYLGNQQTQTKDWWDV